MTRWHVDTVRRRSREQRDSGQPIVLIEKQRQRQVVVQCCRRAQSHGVRSGMPLVQATALLPAGQGCIAPFEPETSRRSLHRLAVWAQRFSPLVAVDDSTERPDTLLLDVTGCDRVWSGEASLLHAVADSMRLLSIEARVTIAPTIGCAWAVARFGSSDTSIVSGDGVRTAIRDLPLESLRIDPEICAQCRAIGLDRIAHLWDLPRSTIPARFGEQPLLRLDQALGQAIEVIRPIRPVPPARRERTFEGPTDRLEAVEIILQQLLEELCSDLATRECGVRILRIELVRSDLDPLHTQITLGRPSRDPQHIWKLIRPKVERANLGFGVEGVSVHAPQIGRITHDQLLHDTQDREPDDHQFQAMLDTLRNHLGNHRVVRPMLRESYIPERACAWVEDATARRSEDRREPVPRERPTLLLPSPEPATVLVLNPDGPVHRLTWRGEEHRINSCIGPERIEGEWWRGHRSTRDYFAVRTDQGQWLWLARAIDRKRWFVHGIWA
ncbi:MAG: DNA polymerase Y family protein [bacterium]|nr:DNA polymerase Y family protein [bacterium]